MRLDNGEFDEESIKQNNTTMTQKGFSEYVYAVYGNKTRAAKSYITAIHIIDQMLEFDDVFGLNGKSITCIDDAILLKRIADFVCSQQTLYIKNKDSFFRNINANQVSYPGKRFCSAAIKQLLNYYKHDTEEKKAEAIITKTSIGTKVSNELVTIFNIDKDGNDVEVTTRVRLGQSYFRRMVFANYENKCCVTGLNVPQTLRASHIVAWAEDKRHRLNPENGLCLSATYDAAFDKHLISFDEDYRMIVSKEIKEYYTNDVAKEYFGDFEGKQIILPTRFMPSKKLLARHRELMIG